MEEGESGPATPEELRDWLRALKERSGLSFEALAQATGESARNIKRWMTAEGKPVVPEGDSLLRLLAALGVELSVRPPASVRSVNAELQALREKIAADVDELVTQSSGQPQPADQAAATLARVLDAVLAQTRLFANQFLGVHAALGDLLEAATLPLEELDDAHRASLAQRREQLQRLESQLEDWQRAS